jgi:hypothetical protein
MGIPSQHSQADVERTVLASVKVLYFMHQVRYGGMHSRMRDADNQRNNISDDEVTYDDSEELQTDPTGKRRNQPTKTGNNGPAAQYQAPPPSVVTIPPRKRPASEPCTAKHSRQSLCIATCASSTGCLGSSDARRDLCQLAPCLQSLRVQQLSTWKSSRQQQQQRPLATQEPLRA